MTTLAKRSRLHVQAPFYPSHWTCDWESSQWSPGLGLSLRCEGRLEQCADQEEAPWRPPHSAFFPMAATSAAMDPTRARVDTHVLAFLCETHWRTLSMHRPRRSQWRRPPGFAGRPQVSRIPEIRAYQGRPSTEAAGAAATRSSRRPRSDFREERSHRAFRGPAEGLTRRTRCPGSRYQVSETPFERLNAAVGSQYEAGVERYHSW